jgi:4-carboxymuconolactone decarboxylase
MASGEREHARRALEAARRARVPRRAAQETALMLVLHAGFPAALEALGLLNEAWPGRADRAREGGRREWRRAGERLCRKVYGDSYPRLMESVERLHPAMKAWMIEEGYGRVLSRPGLARETRELVAVTVLAAGGWERQLVSHLLGARRVGCDTRAIARAVAIGTRRRGTERRAAAARALRRATESRV